MASYPDYQHVAPIFDAMRTETVDGMSVAEMVGAGWPMAVAIHFMEILADHAALAPGDRVLDIGCGCGRIAAALTQHIGPRGSYLGVDIVAGLVDFAARHITPTYPNFRFVTLDESNPAYDQWRHDGVTRAARTIDEVCEAGGIDLVVATSLFTHLDTAMARRTLGTIGRALSPDGRALISLFLLDPAVRALIGRGHAAFQFAHRLEEGAWVQNAGGPLGALAFEHAHFIRLLAEQDLYVERVLYGGWPGRAHHVSGQDILIVRKAPGPLPVAAASAPRAHDTVPSGSGPAAKRWLRATFPKPYLRAATAWRGLRRA